MNHDKWYNYFYRIKIIQGNSKAVAHYWANKLAEEKSDIPFDMY